MNRKFITNLALLLLVNLLVKPFWVFGIDRSVQLAVGEAEYGLYFALFNLSMILNIVLDLGINNFNNRNLSRHPQLLPKHFASLVPLKFTLGVVYAVVTLVLGLAAGYRGHQMLLLAVLAGNQFLSSFVLYLRSNLEALQQFKADSLMSVADRVLMIALCAWLLWGRGGAPMRVEWFAYAQTASYAATALLGLAALRGRLRRPRLGLDPLFSRAILKQSFPYALLTFLMAFYNRIDGVMLERMLPGGEVDAGLYAQGFRVLDAASMFAFLFASLLLPLFAYMIKRGRDVRGLVATASMLLMVPAAVVAAACLVFRGPLVELLYHRSDAYSVAVFGLLMLDFVPIASGYIFGTLLTANGSMRQLNLMAAGAMALNIALNVILIPRFQAVGAAVASLATQLAMAAGQIAVARRVFAFGRMRGYVLRALVFVAAMAAMGWLAAPGRASLPGGWVWHLAGYMAAGLAVAAVLKIFNIRGLVEILRGRGDDDEAGPGVTAAE